MAQEGLDIKTLSTLVMITPKTDIVQTVGRILRVKHSTPIIVDIIDSHEPFQNQWKKRRAYYKKCNYSIKMTDSNKYKNMLDMDNSGIWKTVNTPTSSSCSAKSAVTSTHSDESSGSDIETQIIKKTNRPKVGKCLVDFGFIEQG
jgi:superfamily II DNA or RNA helicase